MFGAYSENDICCYFTSSNAITVSIDPYFFLWWYLCESVDDRNEGRESQPVLLTTFELITQFRNVFVPVYSLNLVVFYYASQEEAAFDIFNVFLEHYFLADLWSEETHVPALEITQN